MRGAHARADADQRLPVLLYVPVLLGAAAAATRRLLRLLFVFGRDLPTEANRRSGLLLLSADALLGSIAEAPQSVSRGVSRQPLPVWRDEDVALRGGHDEVLV